MQIVHISIACFYIEGMGYQENILPRIHKQMGYDVSIITVQSCYNGIFKNPIGHRPVSTYYNEDGVEVTILPDNPVKNKYRQMFSRRSKGLYEKLKEITPDIIFVHGVQTFDTLDVLRYKKENPEVRLFADQHGDYYNMPVNTWKRYWYQRFVIGYIARKTARLVERFWGVTPWRVDYLLNVYKIPRNKVGLLVMGGDDSRIDFSQKEEYRKQLCEKLNFSTDDFIIVTGGKIDRAKNFHLLAEAVKRLPSFCKLVIFGRPTEEMAPYFAQLSDKVQCVGWIPSDESYRYFLAADLGVFPGTHSVLWEQAVACGLPCIFKHWPGMEHVDVGGNAILLDQPTVDAEYIDMLEQTISRLMGRDSEYEKMCQVAEQKGIKEFSYKEIARRAIGIK